MNGEAAWVIEHRPMNGEAETAPSVLLLWLQRAWGGETWLWEEGGALRLPEVSVRLTDRRKLSRALSAALGCRVDAARQSLGLVRRGGALLWVWHVAWEDGELPAPPEGIRWIPVGEEELSASFARLVEPQRQVMEDALRRRLRDEERQIAPSLQVSSQAGGATMVRSLLEPVAAPEPRRWRSADAPPLLVDWRLTGAGWAELTLGQGEQVRRCEHSYLTDAPGELLACALAIAWGARTASCAFELEPGHWRLELRREHWLRVRLIAWRDDPEPGVRGTVKFDGQCDPEAFAREVLATFDATLRHHGIEGFERQWHRYAFPLDLLAALRAAVDDPPPRVSEGLRRERSREG
jgi:hypothetical protein